MNKERKVQALREDFYGRVINFGTNMSLEFNDKGVAKISNISDEFLLIINKNKNVEFIDDKIGEVDGRVITLSKINIYTTEELISFCTSKGYAIAEWLFLTSNRAALSRYFLDKMLGKDALVSKDYREAITGFAEVNNIKLHKTSAKENKPSMYLDDILDTLVKSRQDKPVEIAKPTAKPKTVRKTKVKKEKVETEVKELDINLSDSQKELLNDVESSKNKEQVFALLAIENIDFIEKEFEGKDGLKRLKKFAKDKLGLNG